MSDLPIHIELSGFDVEDNCLSVQNTKIIDIASEVGTLPFYLYSSDLIRDRISELRKSLPKEIELHYAMKANPMPEVVDFVSNYVDGLDVASAGELKIALQTNTPPHEISFAGPGKTHAELLAAVEAGIVLNIESVGELHRLSKIANSVFKTANIAIRVNPDFELKSSGMKMSGGPKPFGIDAEHVPALLEKLGEYAVEFHGLHIFTGSQNLSSEAICEAQTKTLELAIELLKSAPNEPRFVNIGGGFGIPYFPGDKRLDISPIAENLKRLINKLNTDHSNTKLVIELGRYLVGEAGIYVCQIIDKKISRGTIYLIVNGGLHHHLAVSGNFGQVIRKNYPVCVANRVISPKQEKVTIVGPLCTPLDILANNMSLPTAEPGDYVAIFQSGAYGYSASPHDFLGHPHPGEIFL